MHNRKPDPNISLVIHICDITRGNIFDLYNRGSHSNTLFVYFLKTMIPTMSCTMQSQVLSNDAISDLAIEWDYQ
jgi:hypothetical protein